MSDSKEQEDGQEEERADAAAAAEQPKEEIPWRTVCCILLCIMSDSVAQTSSIPYLPAYCKDQLGIPEASVGNVVGLFIGANTIGNVLTGAFIGHWSDRYGRRIFLLVGFVVSAVCTFSLGFIQVFWLAIMARLMTGLFNSNFSLGKAAIADCVPASLRAIPFAYAGATFAIARTIASALGGLTVGVFLTAEYGPFVAPSIIAACPLILSFLVVVFFLPETNKACIKDKGGSEGGGEGGGEDKGGVEQGKADASEKKAAQSSEAKHQSMRVGMRQMLSDHLMVLILCAYGVQAFCAGGLFPAIVLWLTLAKDKHGMGFSSNEAGIALSIFGAFGVVFQLGFFRRLAGYLGLKQMLQLGTMLMAVGTTGLIIEQSVLEVTNGLTSSKWIWGCVAPSMGVLGVGNMLTMPCLNTMLSNAANPEIQGLTHGFAQSTSSVLRALGPIVCGAVFSGLYSVHAPGICFSILILAYTTVFVIATVLPARGLPPFITPIISVAPDPFSISYCDGTRKKELLEQKAEELGGAADMEQALPESLGSRPGGSSESTSYFTPHTLFDDPESYNLSWTMDRNATDPFTSLLGSTISRTSSSVRNSGTFKRASSGRGGNVAGTYPKFSGGFARLPSWKSLTALSPHVKPATVPASVTSPKPLFSIAPLGAIAESPLVDTVSRTQKKTLLSSTGDLPQSDAAHAQDALAPVESGGALSAHAPVEGDEQVGDPTTLAPEQSEECAGDSTVQAPQKSETSGDLTTLASSKSEEHAAGSWDKGEEHAGPKNPPEPPQEGSAAEGDHTNDFDYARTVGLEARLMNLQSAGLDIRMRASTDSGGQGASGQQSQSSLGGASTWSSGIKERIASLHGNMSSRLGAGVPPTPDNAFSQRRRGDHVGGVGLPAGAACTSGAAAPAGVSLPQAGGSDGEGDEVARIRALTSSGLSGLHC